jgi:hypothetical protein
VVQILTRTPDWGFVAPELYHGTCMARVKKDTKLRIYRKSKEQPSIAK